MHHDCREEGGGGGGDLEVCPSPFHIFYVFVSSLSPSQPLSLTRSLLLILLCFLA